LTFFFALLLFGMIDGPLPPAPLPTDKVTMLFVPESQREKEGEKILVRYLQTSRNRIFRGAHMVAHFVGRLPKLKMSATVDARKHVAKDGVIAYEVNERRGDNTVWKELILRYMNGEMEGSGKDTSKVAITPENYKFKYKGERDRDSRRAYVFEVNPRKKREGLFKGEIWVDVDTSLTVLESGRFVKSPSVFLKKVQFTREYSIQDGVAVPKALQTSIETRFWGNAELDIQYSDVKWEDPLAAAN